LEVLKKLQGDVNKESKREISSQIFNEFQNSEQFQRTIIRKCRKHGEVGKSQKEFGDSRLDLEGSDWYVYNDNYGTDQEKYFVEWFNNFYISKKLQYAGWTDIFLARNEKAVKLYSWYEAHMGEGFEPDFVLFMTKASIDYCFYIEPKGKYLFGYDSWKEDLLLEKFERVVINKIPTEFEDTGFRVFGLPFFNNEDAKKREFEVKFKDITDLS
jgi:type III restriction enzyme